MKDQVEKNNDSLMRRRLENHCRKHCRCYFGDSIEVDVDVVRDLVDDVLSVRFFPESSAEYVNEKMQKESARHQRTRKRDPFTYDFFIDEILLVHSLSNHYRKHRITFRYCRFVLWIWDCCL